MINISASHLEIVKKILQKHVPECEVRVFGSRLNENIKSYADLDLAIVGKEKLPIDKIYSLKEDFQESDLPFRVDVLDWNAISLEFKSVIEKGYEILQKRENR
ncbi:MAG: nucleotidyltransferase domain-containing protein [Armatimonadota bacterium]